MAGPHGAASAAGIEHVAAGDTFVHRLDARVKIVGLVALAVVSATTPIGAWAAYAGYLALLVGLAVLARLPLRYTAVRMSVEIPFLVAAAILPFAAPDGLARGGTLALKATVGVLAAVVLSSTTPFPVLLHGFERLHAPRAIVLIVSFMWRYLFVLSDEVRRMRLAQAARGYQARWLWQSRALAAGVAALFVRALERGERVYLAMVSRGYTGGVPPATLAVSPVLAARDVVFLAGLAVVVSAARLAPLVVA